VGRKSRKIRKSFVQATGVYTPSFAGERVEALRVDLDLV